jgi:hypothetical protein
MQAVVGSQGLIKGRATGQTDSPIPPDRRLSHAGYWKGWEGGGGGGGGGGCTPSRRRCHHGR